MTAEIIFDTPAVRPGLAVSVAAVAPALAAEQLARRAGIERVAAHFAREAQSGFSSALLP